MEFRWNDGAKNFTNPAPIGVKMKSTNDITVALSSSSQLRDGSAMIPVKVALNSLGANGTTVPDVSATPKKLYECKSATTFEPFDIQLAADKSGMLDGAGQPITGNDAKPFPGTYSGAVQLLFESDLTSACAL
ncbi:hypothetical protein ECB94_27210 (plasmid) [Vibrio mediterranei]|uniref:Uncharacterized protein n=2 Tax=Vibrio mediterranei TaxID=689 RepID=A0A3G4VJR5_9VIBR|nr:hypothetical protein ECB94_27210 [Vibrio mediterranei]